MIDLKGYKGFKILKNDHTLEANRLSIFCLINNIPLIKVDKPFVKGRPGAYGSSGTEELHKAILMKEDIEKEYIPCGSVEWCEQLLGYHVKPDYYPEWANSLLHRKVWQGDKWLLQKVFVKPSDRYKRFTGFCTTGTYKKKKKGPFWFSEIVKFDNEWRLYITEGEILLAEWYWGDAVNTPDIPYDELQNIYKTIPDNYSGALDIGKTREGKTREGKIVLVESQHPFACGWYGKKENDEIYFQWLIDGWIYMKEVLR